jgi:dUTP pyrophosphatase
VFSTRYSSDVYAKFKICRNELAKEFPLPKLAKDGDVGFDLYSIIKGDYVTLWPQEKVLIPTGISIELPDGYWASIEARSSLSKRCIVVPKGIIDEGYRGEIFAQCINVGAEKQIVYHGDRLVQLILHRNYAKHFEVIEVDELSDTERGADGFGSTGK